MSKIENQSRPQNHTSDDILKCLTQFVLQELLVGGEITELHPEDDLLGSGLIDSLGIMRLVSFVEKEYRVLVPPEDVRIEHFLNLESLTEFLRGLLAEKN